MNERISELYLKSLSDNQEFCYQKFSELVRAEVCEACAEVCDDWPEGREGVYSIAQAIRARGGK